MSQTPFNRYEACKILLGVASIALALGWGKFLGRTAHFPLFPDVLDVTLGVVIGVFLIFDYFKSSALLQNWRKSG